jgi:queuine tRNA-ribosyltransferase
MTGEASVSRAAPRASAFRVLAADPASAARRGRLRTAHGDIDTPVFMPVATLGTVKGMTPRQVRELGARILLANAYHLILRPGVDTVAALGGLHRFMGWDGAILTDSGGFQVMSLSELRVVSEEGVEFRSHLDGSKLFLRPEDVVDAECRLGVDILMPLDVCVAATDGRLAVEQAMERTSRWAERQARMDIAGDRHLFGIVQGGLESDLRRRHAGQLAAFGFPGYAVGGLSVGEDRRVTRDIAAETAAALPVDRSRYLMGVGLPQDLLRFVGMGYDQFDCVLPTRNGRNGMCFTSRGRVNLRLARLARSEEPLDESCECYVCAGFSRGYLRHLTVSGEMLGAQLATLHNLHFYLDLMAASRAHIEAGDFTPWARGTIERIEEGEKK